MKKSSKTATAVIVLLAGLSGAFQVGKSIGFKTGSEWALVQADILAREAGVFMPVYMEGDNLRVVVRQPHGLYKKAWQLADKQEARELVHTAKLKSDTEPQETDKDI